MEIKQLTPEVGNFFRRSYTARFVLAPEVSSDLADGVGSALYNLIYNKCRRRIAKAIDADRINLVQKYYPADLNGVSEVEYTIEREYLTTHTRTYTAIVLWSV